MGLMGQYIDLLPPRAKDRIIEAQDWCVAEVLGPGGARCLVGHAEQWEPVQVRQAWWRRWMDPESGDPIGAAELPPETDLETVCRPEFFTFRRAHPVDLEVYRLRIQRWGLSSESHIGSRFDRLCIRRGVATAIRLVKARAARGFTSAAAAGGIARVPAPATRAG